MPVEGAIIEYPTGKSIKFLYFSGISEPTEPQYEEATVRGRSEEHIFYSHTSANALPFAITLAASVDEKDNGTAKKIWADYLFIKSFGFPDYGEDNKGPVRPPKKAIITIGKWMRKLGVLRSINGEFQPPYDEDGFPMIIQVTFNLRVINATPLSLFDVRAAKDYFNG